MHEELDIAMHVGSKPINAIICLCARASAFVMPRLDIVIRICDSIVKNRRRFLLNNTFTLELKSVYCPYSIFHLLRVHAVQIKAFTRNFLSKIIFTERFGNFCSFIQAVNLHTLGKVSSSIVLYISISACEARYIATNNAFTYVFKGLWLPL